MRKQCHVALTWRNLAAPKVDGLRHQILSSAASCKLLSSTLPLVTRMFLLGLLGLENSGGEAGPFSRRD
jgi:hypothetical protein